MFLPSNILEKVKNYLDITWEDPESDKKLSGIISRGMQYLNSVGAKEFNYSVDDKPLELLLDYVRYVRSNALDEFQLNYLHELRRLQTDVEVGKYD